MKHILRFYSGSGMPTIMHREGSEVSPLALPAGSSQDIVFSERLSCIGFRTPEKYCACRNSAIHIRQCPTCAALDVSRAYTVGDFSGYPQLYEEAKKEEYCLYLAGFGEDIVKCGVTRKERFEERMLEQGADFGCLDGIFTGPDEVYGAESAIQSRFSFNNAVRLAQKIRRLEFDFGAARENFSSAVELVKGSGVLPEISSSIIDFSPHYPRVHSPQQTYSILGEILGAKGEILLFKSDSAKHFAVNMRQQVGAFLQKGAE